MYSVTQKLRNYYHLQNELPKKPTNDKKHKI